MGLQEPRQRAIGLDEAAQFGFCDRKLATGRGALDRVRQTKIEEKDEAIGQDDEVLEVFRSNRWLRPTLESVSMLAKSALPFAPNIGVNQRAKFIQPRRLKYSSGGQLSPGPKVNRKVERLRGGISTRTTRTERYI